MKILNVAIGLLVGAALGLGAGYLLWGGSQVAGPGGAPGFMADGARPDFQNMTAEERQQFFDEQGMEAPEGGFADGPGGDMMRPGGIEGTVISMDADSVTIELTDGGSQTVYLSNETEYAAVSGEGASLLTDGAEVTISGTPEADGVFTATSIVVR